MASSTIATTTEVAENGSFKAPESDQRMETTDAATVTATATDSEPVGDDHPLSGSAPEETMPIPATASADEGVKKWPGWPGDYVFRLIVPVLKVSGIIGCNGEIIKKMSQETGACIRVLDAPNGTSDRIVLKIELLTCKV